MGTPSKTLLMFARSNKTSTKINKIFSEVIEVN